MDFIVFNQIDGEGPAMDHAAINAYLRTHQKPLTPARRRGLIALDLSPFPEGGEPVPTPEDQWQLVLLKLGRAQQHLNTARYEERAKAQAQIPSHYHPLLDPPFTYMGEAERLVAEATQDILGLLGKAPEPGPEPGPGYQFQGHTWPTHHDGTAAADVYYGPPGTSCLRQEHILQVDVTMEPHSTWSPLEIARDYRDPHWDLLQAAEALGTQMYTVVGRLARPLPLPNGRVFSTFWVSHVAQDSPLGLRKAGEVAWITGESGVEFWQRIPEYQPGDAAHDHLAGSYDGRLSPNGDIPGPMIAMALGIMLDVWEGLPPGPMQYFARQAWRGLHRPPPGVG
jgi:hypothetical protein